MTGLRRAGEPGAPAAQRHRALPRAPRGGGGRPLPRAVAAYRWLREVFEPAIAAIPPELLDEARAAELFHELLEHRWFLSQQAGKDVGLHAAVDRYVEDGAAQRARRAQRARAGRGRAYTRRVRRRLLGAASARRRRRAGCGGTETVTQTVTVTGTAPKPGSGRPRAR